MTAPVHVGDLEIDGSAQLDLNNKSLIADGSATGVWDGSSYTGIMGMVQSGRIASSAIAAGDTLQGIGVASAADVFGLAGAATASWNGQTVGAGDTLVMFTYAGDANLDGKINIDDYGRIDANVGFNGSVHGWYNGDFNYDGAINIDDYGIIDSNIGIQGSPLLSASQPLGGFANLTPVPEPATLAASAVLTATAFLRRRRRRRAR
jgi:hypothetical protein